MTTSWAGLVGGLWMGVWFGASGREPVHRVEDDTKGSWLQALLS